MTEVINRLTGMTDEVFWAAIIGMTVIQSLFLILVRRISPQGPASYRVTFLGPPGSGKTSAAIAIIDYLINSDVSGHLRLRGEATIDAVHQGVKFLNQGIYPPRTLETSTNIYRIDYSPPQSAANKLASIALPISKTFRVEIADFAGELTEDFSERSGLMRSNSIQQSFGDDASSNYLKWVSESDRCLIFIDMQKYQDEGVDYANEITAMYVSFWQRYLDLHAEKSGPRAGTPVVIVHSKCDAFEETFHQVFPSENTQDVGEFGMRRERDFAKLYNFFNHNSRQVDKVFISVVSGDGVTRFGISSLAKSILPSRRAWRGSQHVAGARHGLQSA